MTSKRAAAPRRTKGHPARAVPPVPAQAGTRLRIEAVRAAWGAALLAGPGIVLEQVFRTLLRHLPAGRALLARTAPS